MSILTKFYSTLISIGAVFQPLVLLALRGFWGWQLFVAGRDKLLNVAPVIEFFTSIGIPLPTFNVYAAGYTELVGGACLLAGFATRLVSIPLLVVMGVALYTAHHAVLISALSDPKELLNATPLSYIVALLVLFAFGPGMISIDALLKRIFNRNGA